MIDARLVRDWLEREEHEVEVIEDARTHWHFAFRFPREEGMLTQVVCPKDREHTIQIVRGIDLAENHRKGLEALSAAEFNSFRFNLLHDLLIGFAVDYALEIDNEKRSFTRFAVRSVIRDDGLTSQSLYEALAEVHDAALLVIIRIRNTVGEPA